MHVSTKYFVILAQVVFSSPPTDPIEWNTANVQKWLLWTEHLYRLPHAGKAFQELTGKDLCAMSEEEFRQRSPLCGDTLHAHLDIWKSGTGGMFI